MHAHLQTDKKFQLIFFLLKKVLKKIEMKMKKNFLFVFQDEIESTK